MHQDISRRNPMLSTFIQHSLPSPRPPWRPLPLPGRCGGQSLSLLSHRALLGLGAPRGRRRQSGGELFLQLSVVLADGLPPKVLLAVQVILGRGGRGRGAGMGRERRAERSTEGRSGQKIQQIGRCCSAACVLASQQISSRRDDISGGRWKKKNQAWRLPVSTIRTLVDIGRSGGATPLVPHQDRLWNLAALWGNRGAMHGASG